MRPAAVVADDDAGIFQIDQMLDLQLPQLVKLLIGGVPLLVGDTDQIVMPLPPCPSIALVGCFSQPAALAPSCDRGRAPALS